MEIVYGEGLFIEESATHKGIITLGEHKLFLKTPESDLTRTYIPLEKIESIKLSGCHLSVFVRPGAAFFFTVMIKGENRKIKQLTHELVRRRCLKKRFLRQQWYEIKR